MHEYEAINFLNAHNLELHLKKNWGSDSKNFRSKIEASLSTRSIRLPCPNVSLSHSPKLGGWIKGNLFVGLDIEETKRVSAKIISRVVQPSELGNYAWPASLWCAKESSFKALRSFNQPVHFSQIEIKFTENRPNLFCHFRVLNEKSYGNISGEGVVFNLDEHTIAITIFRRLADIAEV